MGGYIWAYLHHFKTKLITIMKKAFFASAITITGILSAQHHVQTTHVDGHNTALVRIADRDGFDWGGFGVKAGTNFSTVSTNGYDETKAKMGFYAGIFYNAPLGKSGVRIQPELIYNNLGGEASERKAPTDITESYAVNLNYLTLPLMFQIQPAKHFYLEVGPSIGYLINASTKTTLTKQDRVLPLESTRRDLNTADFNKWNLGVSGGLGANVSKDFAVNIRYTYGFSDLTAPGTDPNVRASNRNNNFQLGLNYKF